MDQVALFKPGALTPSPTGADMAAVPAGAAVQAADDGFCDVGCQLIDGPWTKLASASSAANAVASAAADGAASASID